MIVAGCRGLPELLKMHNNFLERMLDLAVDGGRLSLRIMKNSRPTLKPDNSVLTEADTAISGLARRSLHDLLKTHDHALIDEEDKDSGRYFDQAALEKIPYLWVIDPIDGTRGFSNRMPLYGVSIGLLKDLKPWLGVVYFPALDELFYCDGRKSYFAVGAASGKLKKTVIVPVDQRITPQSVFFGSDAFFKEFTWDFSLCQIMLPSCAVIDLCWPAVGRGCGSFFNANIWDFAGSWPIFRSAGLDLRSRTEGRVLERVGVEFFEGQGSRTWRLREHYILSSRRNFDVIARAIRRRS